MKIAGLGISICMAIAVASCGYDGQNKCEKAKKIAIEGFKEYCLGKEEVCGACSSCDGDNTILVFIWNEYGTDLIITCLDNSEADPCALVHGTDLTICPCEGSNLERAESCLEDVDACKQGWANTAEDNCEKSMP